MTIILLGLACVLPQEDAAGPQEMKVQMREATLYKQASRLRGVVRKAKYSEVVVVTETRGRFSKVTLEGGGEAWILSSALVPSKEFVREASNEREEMELKSQGYEGRRFGPGVEKEYRAEKGPAMDAAYVQLDELEGRRPEVTAREERLRKFREAGKLGEFASVKSSSK